MPTFKTLLSDFNSNLWGHHLLIPGEIGKPFIEEENRRVICTLNGSLKIHSALMPKGNDYFILINKAVRSQLNIKVGDEVEVLLEKDHSDYGMPMPEELSVVLQQEEVASQRFHALTLGKQRSLIYIVSKVKSTDSRIKKALAIADHLRNGDGQIDFKALNELIKYYNRKG